MQSIIAEKRDILGKRVNTLRKQGFLPAVLYGKQKKAEPLAVREIDFLKLWKSAGESSIIEVKVGEEKYNALVQDVAMDPLKDRPLHVDFYIVEMDKPIKINVPLEFIGESEAVKSGGILVKVLHEIKIEALPKNLPHSLSVDLSQLKNIGESLTIKDLKISQDVKILDNVGETIVLIEPPRTEEAIKGETETAPSIENIEVVGKKAKEEEFVDESAEKKQSKSEKTEKKKDKEK